MLLNYLKSLQTRRSPSCSFTPATRRAPPPRRKTLATLPLVHHRNSPPHCLVLWHLELSAMISPIVNGSHVKTSSSFSAYSENVNGADGVTIAASNFPESSEGMSSKGWFSVEVVRSRHKNLHLQKQFCTVSTLTLFQDATRKCITLRMVILVAASPRSILASDRRTMHFL